MANYNVKRIERDIEKYIPLIIQRETSDDFLKTITITGCKLAHDLSFCKVYFTSISEIPKNEAQKRANDASSFIRGKLAGLMEIRNTPLLRFEYDNSIEYGNRIEEVIKKLHE